MILGFYLLSCFITMGLMSLQMYLSRQGYINVDPFEAMDEINKIIEEQKDPRIRQMFENFVNSMIQSPLKFQLAISFCPLINIFHSFKTIRFILNNTK